MAGERKAASAETLSGVSGRARGRVAAGEGRGEGKGGERRGGEGREAEVGEVFGEL